MPKKHKAIKTAACTGNSHLAERHRRCTTIVNTVGEASNVFGSSVTGKDYVYDKIDITDVINDWKGSNPITLNIIPIDVEWTSNNVPVAARLNNKQTTYKKDAEGKLLYDENRRAIPDEDSEEVGVPHILQVPIGTAWPQERVNIGLKEEGPYHLFPNYVSEKDKYKDKVWKEQVNQFYLYPDNRTPLAYSSDVNYPVGYDYLTDIVPYPLPVQYFTTSVCNISQLLGIAPLTTKHGTHIVINDSRTSVFFNG